MNKLSKWMCLGLLSLLMVGCQSPVHRAMNKGLQLGVEQPEDMRDRNTAMFVMKDEVHLSQLDSRSQNFVYLLGAGPKEPVAQYRVVYLGIKNPSRVFYVAPGASLYPMAAIVPDHIPRLYEGDVVEVRQLGSFDVVRNFDSTKEGNIVLRVMCQIQKPDFGRCLMNNTPRIEKHFGFGPTKTPYLASVAQSGFSFTPFYDELGTAIRSFPK